MLSVPRQSAALVFFLLTFPLAAAAQGPTTLHVATETQLRNALSSVTAGDTIVFDADIAITTGDLPSVATTLVIDGAGHTLSGSNQFRGLIVAGYSGGSGPTPVPIDVSIQDLAITNAVATGGDGGTGLAGGGGGAGLGGALLVGDLASVTLTNVALTSNAAVGGNGGAAGAGPGGGGGGGLGGVGGAGGVAGGGGGGVGNTAAGGSNSAGAPGSLFGGDVGGFSGFPGGFDGGGGGSSTAGGAGGGDGGGNALNGDGAVGGFGGGGGGSLPAGVAAAGGFGGGGGGGQSDGGSSAFAGGGGGSAGGVGGAGGRFGGTGAGPAGGSGGGGGAALGGAIFVRSGASLNIAGAFTVNGNAVTGGVGGPGAGGGQAHSTGLYLDGFGTLRFDTAAGQTATVADAIDDEAAYVPASAGPGTWDLAKDGAGTLVLSGVNGYSGGTAVNDGTLSVASAASLGTGAVLVDTPATLAITGSTVFANDLALSGTPTIDVSAGLDVTWNGQVIDGSDLTFSALHLTGGGALTLGSNLNTYLNGTTITGGSTLRVGGDGALGDANGDVTLGDGTTGGTLGVVAGSTFVSNRRVSLGAGGGTLDVQAGASATLTSDLSGSGGLSKTGGGSLVLATNSTYTGSTSVSGGVLRAGGQNVFSQNGAMIVDAAGALDLNNFDQTVGSLAGGGSVALGTAALTTGGNNLSTTFAGSISGTGSLSKIGAGTLILRGANSYSGGTTVLAGSLVGDSASLQGSIANSALVVFDQAGSGTFTGAMTGGGTLTKTGAGALTLTGANTYSGGTNVTAGTLIGTTTSLQGSIANGGQVIFDQASDGIYAGVMSGSGGLGKSGSGTLTLAGANTYTGGTTVAGGTLVGSATTLRGAISNNARVVFEENAVGTYAGSMSGTGVLGKSGSGTLTLTGTNSYTGGTNVAAGTLVGNASTLQGDVANNARVVFDQETSGAYSGSMTGAGALVKTGAGALTLTGANTYAGGTSVAGGTLIGNSSSLQGAIANDGVVVFEQAGLGTFAGVMSGTGALAKTGSGTLILTAANAYTGGTTVTRNGALAIDADSRLGGSTGRVQLGDSSSSGGLTILSGSAFSTGRSISLGAGGGIFNTEPGSAFVLNGAIDGSGGLVKIGAGTLTLAGPSTYSGGTIVSGGTLAGSASTLHGQIIDNANVIFGGAGDGTFDGVLMGTGSLTKMGSGTLTLPGVHSLTGPTSVAQGTLVLNGGLGGGVGVAPGATLRAAGTVAGNVNLSGSLMAFPPASAGLRVSEREAASVGVDRLTTPPVLTIGGDLNASRGSVIGFPLGAGPSPSILVGGHAALNGTHLDLTAEDPGNRRSTTFLALTAERGLSMTDTDVQTQRPELQSILTQDSSSLFVTLLNLQIPLTTAVSTGNGAAVAGALDRTKMAATGDRALVVRELTALDDEGLKDALETISGEIHSSALHLAVLDSEAFTDLVRGELTMADHDGTGRYGSGMNAVRWWTQFSGEHARLGPTGDARGAVVDLGAGGGGFDWRGSDRWSFGGGGGFGAGHMGMSALDAGTDFKAPRAFAHVGFKPRGFGLRGGGSTARTTYKTARRIAFAATAPLELGAALLTGGIDRLAESEQTGTVSDTWSEYNDNTKVKTYTLDWMVGVRHARITRDAFDETGALSLSLSGDDDTLSLTQTDVKLHLWRREGRIRPFFETTLRRELTDGETSTAVQFTGVDNSSFKVDGLTVPGNTFIGRGGVTWRTWLGSLTFEYQLHKSPGQTRQTADLRVRFK
jgi:autotransporter-associated beta strand protein